MGGLRYSEPRFTKDLDLLIGTDPENLERAVKALALFGAPESIVAKARALRPDEFLFFGVSPARVDLLRSIQGVDFVEAFLRRIEVTWGETVVYVIAKDDLIRAKRASGREKDLRDLRVLERAK